MINNCKQERVPSKRLSVVQLHSYDYGGGAEAVARLNHAGLAGLGHSSQLLVAKKLGDDPDIDQIEYISGFPGSLRIARKVEQLCGLQYTYSPSFRNVSSNFRINPDVVHLHSMHGAMGWADLIGLSRLADAYPIVCSLHDLWLLTGHCVHPMECERWKFGCGKCPDLSRYPAIPKDGTHWNWKRKKMHFRSTPTSLIAPSKWVEKQARSSDVLSSCPIDIVPNPINLEVFKPGDCAEARGLLGIPQETPTVMIVANDLRSPFKGIQDAIDVVNGLVDTNAFILLVGIGSDELVEKICLPSKSFRKLESQSELAVCYRASDVLLLPSKVETFGLVAAEATACGAVVVSYRAGGLEEVTSLCEGIVVGDGQINEMLLATKNLLASHGERRARIIEGQRNVRRFYSIAEHSSACVEVYERAIRAFGNRDI